MIYYRSLIAVSQSEIELNYHNAYDHKGFTDRIDSIIQNVTEATDNNDLFDAFEAKCLKECQSFRFNVEQVTDAVKFEQIFKFQMPDFTSFKNHTDSQNDQD
jgi:hypothetical protein